MYGIISNNPVIKKSADPIVLTGKSVIIVGGTAGIGQGIAHAAKAAGASVIVVGRTLRDEGLTTNFVKADLSSIQTARQVANNLPFESADYVMFTAGIVPGKEKKLSNEGIELDMAVSALNRHEMLKIAAPRLKKTARVFIWGFPGSVGYYKKTNIHDFNSEQSYAGGFESAHMNTVALNEAQVYHWAAKGMHIAGFNPGIIRTGIREPLLGSGCFASCMETCFGLCNPSVEKYSQTILNIMVAPELETNNGLSFHQNGQPIKRTPELEDAKNVAAWIAAADNLVSTKVKA